MTDWALKWQMQRDKKLRKRILKKWEKQSKPYYKSENPSTFKKTKKIKKLKRRNRFNINRLNIDNEDLSQIIELISKIRLLKRRDKKIVLRFFQYRYNEKMKIKDCHKLIAKYFGITRENIRVIKHRAWKMMLGRVQKILSENQSEVKE